MIDPAMLPKLLQELEKLNTNLESVKKESQEWKPIAMATASELKTLNIRLKGVVATGKQISILNQILVQVGRAQGITAMFGKLIDGITRFGRKK